MDTMDLRTKYGKYQGKLAEAVTSGDKEKIGVYRKKIHMYGGMLQRAGAPVDDINAAKAAAIQAIDGIRAGTVNTDAIDAKVAIAAGNYNKLQGAYKDLATDSVSAIREVQSRAEEKGQQGSTATETALPASLQGINDLSVDEIIARALGQA